MARYIELYRISQYWRHIVPYRDNYRSNKFDIPYYSGKSRCQQQTVLIAIGIINNNSDWWVVISVIFQDGMVHSTDWPIGGECEECPYQPGWGGGMFV